MTSKSIVLGGVAALLVYLALRGRSPSSAPPAQEPDVEPWEDEPDDEGAPIVGEFWRWPNVPLPLIRRDSSRRLMGVYSPTGNRRLIAVVDSAILDSSGRYLVISTSAMSDFPATFPSAASDALA